MEGKCNDLFWMGDGGYPCEREHGHGGSHTTNGTELHPHAEAVRVFFTVSWHTEPERKS
jgi:hypothetical protein